MDRTHLFDYIDADKPALEIGPLHSPFLTRPRFDVYYADINSTEEVIALYQKDTNVDVSKIVPIDYMVKDVTYAQAVGDKRFDAVFSSHVIEHTHDIIRHIREIGDVLTEDGRYILCVPDKRFTFDHFREVTPFRDAFDVYMNGEDSLRRLAFDGYLNYHSCNIPMEYIDSNVSHTQIVANDTRSLSAMKSWETFDINTAHHHFWVFTYASFMALIRDLLRFRMLPFELETAISPEPGSNEFHVVLRKNTEMLTNDHLRKSEIIKINVLAESENGDGLNYRKTQSDLMQFISANKNNYIYGPASSESYLNYLLEENFCKITGRFVSAGYPKDPLNLPVYHPEEIGDDSAGIIIAVSKTHHKAVFSNLSRLNLKNTFIFLR